MKLYIFLIIFVTITSFVGCKNDTVQQKEPTQDDEWAVLRKQRENIIFVAKSVGCVASTQCRFIGIGSKPCGGPEEYLIYSNAVDTVELFSLVSKYNMNEDSFYQKWEIGSNCEVPPEPDSIRCIGDKCVGYWEGVPRE